MGRPGDRETLYLKEGVGPFCGEVWLVLVTQDLVGQGALDLGVMQLPDCQLAAFAGHILLHLRDLDLVGPGRGQASQPSNSLYLQSFLALIASPYGSQSFFSCCL